MKLLEKILIYLYDCWWYENYTQIQLVVFGLASFALYGALSSLFGYFWLFATISVLLLILGALSLFALVTWEKFFCAYEDEPGSLWTNVCFGKINDWFCENELWNRYLENELLWLQKILLYTPFTALLALELLGGLFIGVFDHMRHNLNKTFDDLFDF